MEVNHGGIDPFMAKQVFDGDDVHSELQKVSYPATDNNIKAHKP